MKQSSPLVGHLGREVQRVRSGQYPSRGSHGWPWQHRHQEVCANSNQRRRGGGCVKDSTQTTKHIAIPSSTQKNLDSFPVPTINQPTKNKPLYQSFNQPKNPKMYITTTTSGVVCMCRLSTNDDISHHPETEEHGKDIHMYSPRVTIIKTWTNRRDHRSKHFF